MASPQSDSLHLLLSAATGVKLWRIPQDRGANWACDPTDFRFDGAQINCVRWNHSSSFFWFLRLSIAIFVRLGSLLLLANLSCFVDSILACAAENGGIYLSNIQGDMSTVLKNTKDTVRDGVGLGGLWCVCLCVCVHAFVSVYR